MQDFSFSEYDQRAAKTAIYPGKGELLGLTYVALKMSGEAGEVAEKVGKRIRDKGGDVSDPVFRTELKKEIGDVLWYLSAAAHEIGTTLEEVAITNLTKLESRKERGVLGGSGDNR